MYRWWIISDRTCLLNIDSLQSTENQFAGVIFDFDLYKKQTQTYLCLIYQKELQKFENIYHNAIKTASVYSISQRLISNMAKFNIPFLKEENKIQILKKQHFINTFPWNKTVHFPSFQNYDPTSISGNLTWHPIWEMFWL